MPSLGHGGAEQNLLTILRQLSREPTRYRNHLAWLGGDEALREAFEPHVASMIRLDAHGRVGQLRAAAKLARWVRENRPDVIHTQLVDAQIVARVAALLARRRPVVTTWQCVLYHDVVDFGGSRWIRGVVRLTDMLTGLADRRFIAVSDYVATECARDLAVDRNRVEVIYNALDPERIRPVERETLARTRRELGVAEDARIILSVARLHPQKGHVDLLDAMPEVFARVPRAVLLLAGRGPLESELRARVERLSLSGRVHLLGARRDVAALYQLADLFAFPSYYEGLSVALVEALANGLPAVVSEIPQNREVADGFSSVRFVSTAAPREIARAAIDLLERGAAVKAAARAAQEDVRARFSSEVLAARFGHTLERAAGLTHARAAHT